VRLIGSDKLLLGGFVVLAIGSIGLKAVAGPPRDGLTDSRPGQLEDQLQSKLKSQGFVAELRPMRMRAPVVYARKGQCELTVRDARGGESFAEIFVQDARSIGPVRYLYGGSSYSAMPGIGVRLGRFGAEVQSRLGFASSAPVPVVLATSPACGLSDFGLDDVRIGT
jgi:hypothetical protein